jgi:hypothetical protein
VLPAILRITAFYPEVVQTCNEPLDASLLWDMLTCCGIWQVCSWLCNISLTSKATAARRIIASWYADYLPVCGESRSKAGERI